MREISHQVKKQNRIPVMIHAPDPILREGAIAHLRTCPEIDLIDAITRCSNSIALLLEESVDQLVLSRLRKMVRSAEVQPVLVINALCEADLLDVIESGVRVVVWRHEVTTSRLLKAVTSAFHGEGDLPVDLLTRLMGQVKALRPEAMTASNAHSGYLTPRETEVLQLIADGEDAKTIAEKLSYSQRTIKSIMQGITARMNLSNRTHAVAYVMRQGYIS
ncbi:response regulator transcription factor [Streptomyces sp. NPDC047070]|uniref:helix-turn-helix transcriptional regulator n=1 Tax=Streptomyces sp. NPDC047070 TaxID=3154923 RepID=UPI003451B881